MWKKKLHSEVEMNRLYVCHPTWQPSLLLPRSGSPWRYEQLPPDCSGAPAAHGWRCPSLWRFDRLGELPRTWLTLQAADQRGHKQDTHLHASQDLLAVRLHGFGILEVHLWRGDIWEQFSYLQPKCKNGSKVWLYQEEKFPEYWQIVVLFSPVLGANVDWCSLVVVLAFLIKLGCFRELL